mmetsp:Transcript_8270/g.18965  ORF Transcript_8270/g.18965 Transcript_8270/m.18965 type:complete len:203 (-) Transcript_8270:480-1088(-)
MAGAVRRQPEGVREGLQPARHQGDRVRRVLLQRQDRPRHRRVRQGRHTDVRGGRGQVRMGRRLPPAAHAPEVRRRVRIRLDRHGRDQVPDRQARRDAVRVHHGLHAGRSLPDGLQGRAEDRVGRGRLAQARPHRLRDRAGRGREAVQDEVRRHGAARGPARRGRVQDGGEPQRANRRGQGGHHEGSGARDGVRHGIRSRQVL